MHACDNVTVARVMDLQGANHDTEDQIFRNRPQIKSHARGCLEDEVSPHVERIEIVSVSGKSFKNHSA